MVRHITVNDINVGRNVDEILRLIKAHQFVEVSELVSERSTLPSQSKDLSSSTFYFNLKHNRLNQIRKINFKSSKFISTLNIVSNINY